MKRISFTLSMLCLTVVAKATPAVYAFEMTNQSGLSNDKKIIVSSTTSTTLYFTVGISRALIYPSFVTYESVDLKYTIYFKSTAGVEDVLGGHTLYLRQTSMVPILPRNKM